LTTGRTATRVMILCLSSYIVNTIRKLALLVLLMAGALSGDDPLQLDPELDTHLRAALEASYCMDFAGARRSLAAAEKWAPDHPLVPFGELLIEWWMVTAAVWEEDADRSQLMLDAIERSLAAAERKIEAGDPTGEGHLVKGATLGLLGRWHIKNRHWWKSYHIGRDAKEQLTRAREINPELYDAYAGIGIYDYFVAKLPGIVRWLAFSGQTADPADGMRLINLSLERGDYTLVGTRAALVLIHLRNELDPASALELADELVVEHPHSPFFGSLRMIALYDLGQVEALAEEAERQANLLAAGDYPPSRQAQVAFAEGLAHFRAGEWDLAAADYMRAIEVGNATDPFTTWAKLHLGNIADVRGDRKAARSIYREVKGALNRWGTRRLADRYLKSRFNPAVHQVRLLPDGNKKTGA